MSVRRRLLQYPRLPTVDRLRRGRHPCPPRDAGPRPRDPFWGLPRLQLRRRPDPRRRRLDRDDRAAREWLEGKNRGPRADRLCRHRLRDHENALRRRRRRAPHQQFDLRRERPALGPQSDRHSGGAPPAPRGDVPQGLLRGCGHRHGPRHRLSRAVVLDHRQRAVAPPHPPGPLPAVVCGDRLGHLPPPRGAARGPRPVGGPGDLAVDLPQARPRPLRLRNRRAPDPPCPRQ